MREKRSLYFPSARITALVTRSFYFYLSEKKFDLSVKICLNNMLVFLFINYKIAFQKVWVLYLFSTALAFIYFGCASRLAGP